MREPSHWTVRLAARMDIRNGRVASAIDVLGTPGLGLQDLAIPDMPTA